MRTATFIALISFFLFAILGMVSALPEAVKDESIVARDVDTTPALEGIGALVARGDDGKGHKYCWDQRGYQKCGKRCCKRYESCCGNRCCGKGYKCYKGGKGGHDGGKDKRGDDDDDHHGGKGGHYGWYCKKSHGGW